MIDKVANILTSNALVNLSQNTAARVSVETGLKAVGRPGFILIDKDLDKDTKKYASVKELLYQLICLGVYLAIIPTVFKNGSFALAKKLIYKNTKGFEKFKNAGEFLDFYKVASLDKAERLNAVRDAKFLKKFAGKQELIDELKSDGNVQHNYYLQKGVIETGSLIGSVLGLAILAPEVSHHLIHPIMRVVGLEKKENAEAKADVKVDTKA